MVQISQQLFFTLGKVIVVIMGATSSSPILLAVKWNKEILMWEIVERKLGTQKHHNTSLGLPPSDVRSRMMGTRLILVGSLWLYMRMISCNKWISRKNTTRNAIWHPWLKGEKVSEVLCPILTRRFFCLEPDYFEICQLWPVTLRLKRKELFLYDKIHIRFILSSS